MNWGEMTDFVYYIAKLVEKGYQVDVVDHRIVCTLEGQDVIEISSLEEAEQIIYGE